LGVQLGFLYSPFFGFSASGQGSLVYGGDEAKHDGMDGVVDVWVGAE